MVNIKKDFLYIAGMLFSAVSMIAAIFCAVGLVSRFESPFIKINPIFIEYNSWFIFAGFVFFAVLSFLVSYFLRSVKISLNAENTLRFFNLNKNLCCPKCNLEFNRPSFDEKGKTCCPLCGINLKKPKLQKALTFMALIGFNGLIISKYLFGLSGSIASFFVIVFFVLYIFLSFGDWSYEVDK